MGPLKFTPSFLLAPAFHFQPGGLIAIGKIITNPFVPHWPINRIDETNPLEVEESPFVGVILRYSSEDGVTANIWTKITDVIAASVGRHPKVITTGVITTERPVAVYLKDSLSDRQIRDLCNAPWVKEYMRLDTVRCRPVYLVSALRIAKGMAYKSARTETAASKSEPVTRRRPMSPPAGGRRWRPRPTKTELSGTS